jgi:hypothetical protein
MKTMNNLRSQLIQKIQETPDDLLQEFLDFLLFIQYKKARFAHKVDYSYPLRGLPVEFVDPTEPVAMDDWDALSVDAKITSYSAIQTLS